MNSWRAVISVGVILSCMVAASAAQDGLELVGQSPYGWSEDVAVGGTTAVMGNGRAMQVVDLTDPSNPVVVGEVTVPNLVKAVEVTDDKAFVGTSSVLTVVDISDPENPTPLGTLEDLWIRDLIFEGGSLYVLGFDELVVVDVSTPTSPAIIGGLEWPDDHSVDLSVQGTTGFIIVDGSLRVLDLSDPAAPSEITELSFGVDRDARCLDVLGDHAFVIMSGPDPFDYAFAVVDVSDPSHPGKVTEIAASFASRDIHIHGDLALVNGDGLEIFDVSNPASPLARGSEPIECFYYLNTVVATGDAALVTCEVTGLNIIDISDPDAPSQMAMVSAPGSIEGAAAANGALFIAADDQGLRVVDVVDPSQPAELGSAEEPPFAAGVETDGDAAYVVGPGLTVLDVSDPGAPEVLGSAAGLYCNWVTVEGLYAYLVYEWTGILSVVDVSLPEAPTLVGSLELAAETWQWPVVIGDHLIVRNNHNDPYVAVIDVGNPALPVQDGVIDIWANFGGLAATGSWLLVPDIIDGQEAAVRIFDMSDPANPNEIAPYLPVGGAVDLIEIAGSVAYLSVIDNPPYQTGAIEAVDIGNPRAPVFMGLQPRQGWATRITSNESAVFILDRQTGFDAFALCHGPLFADGFESGNTDQWAGVMP